MDLTFLFHGHLYGEFLSDVNIFQGNELTVKCTIQSRKLMLIVLHSREALYQHDDKIERNMRKTMPGDRMHYCVILITKPGGVNSRLGHKRTVVFVCTFHLRFTFWIQIMNNERENHCYTSVLWPKICGMKLESC